MASVVTQNPKVAWLDGQDVRPYIFVREDNRTWEPGTRFESDWFPFEPLFMDPLKVKNVGFADQILDLEAQAFGKSGMAMPRWVFYDCAIMPGFVAGFAMRTEKLSAEMRKVLNVDTDLEWTPISLFIAIPCRSDGEWVAHNLSSVNSLLPREARLYGLGFLTKAFALWQANIGNLCGVTQWKSPAIKLHSFFGAFEVLTAFTPVHSYPHTLTYRTKVDPYYWNLFFTKGEPEGFEDSYAKAGFQVRPGEEEDLRDMQGRMERGEGPFYLNPREVRLRQTDDPLTIYRRIQ